MKIRYATQLFVSHSSADTELAHGFVDLVARSFDGKRKNILCTDVEGHKLPFGDVPRDSLAEKLRNSLVVGLLTPHSIKSSWVLFELGAAWGLSQRVVPVLVGLTAAELPAALKESVAALGTDPTDVLGVIDQIGETLGWAKSRSSVVADAAHRFADASKMRSYTNPERFLFRRDLIKELPWSKVSEQTEETLYIWAWSGVAAYNERTRNTFISLLREKRKVNFMILNPKVAEAVSKTIRMHPVCSWTAPGVRKDMAKARRNLINFRTGLTGDEKKFLDLRETDWFMAWSGLAVDPEKDAGVLQIESYLYNYADAVKPGNHLDFRPNVLLTRKSNFFEPYWYSIKGMWKAAAKF